MLRNGKNKTLLNARGARERGREGEERGGRDVGMRRARRTDKEIGSCDSLTFGLFKACKRHGMNVVDQRGKHRVNAAGCVGVVSVNLQDVCHVIRGQTYCTRCLPNKQKALKKILLFLGANFAVPSSPIINRKKKGKFDFGFLT